MISSQTFLLNFTIPGYTILKLLDETLDSINVLARSTKTKNLFSIRIFNNDEISQDLINHIINYNELVQRMEKDENKNIFKSSGTNRFLTYDIIQDDSKEHYFAIKTFTPRTIEFLCFFGDELFEEEKHAICLQLGQIYQYLKDEKQLFPVFPSRLILNDDLFLQLTDLYEPNPIDEEAYEMGWFDEGITNKDFFVRIIKWIWNISEEEAEQKLELYLNLDSDFLSWGKEFIKKHRHSSDTKGLPPLIAFDINRAKALLNDAPCICYALTKMIDEMDGLTTQMIKDRAVTVALELMIYDIDIIQANVLLFTIKIIEKIGFAPNEQESRKLEQKDFTLFIDKIASSNHKAARFTLYCKLPSIIKLLPYEDSKNLVVYLAISAEKQESYVFVTKFTEIMNALNEINESSNIKSFICQIIDLLKKQDYLSDPFLSSLINLDTSLYNVDSVLLSMPEQLLSVTSLKYLISVVKSASPALRYRFNLSSALLPISLCSLALKYIEILREITPSADFYALIPPNMLKITYKIPDSPMPINDNKIQQIQTLITAKTLKFDIINTKITTKINMNHHFILHIEKLLDFSYNLDGKYFVICEGKCIKIFNSNSLFSSFKFTGYELVKLSQSSYIYSLVCFQEKIVFVSKDNNSYSLNECTIGNKSSLKRISSYTKKISFIWLFEEALLLFIIFNDGDIYCKKDGDLPFFFFNIPLSFGKVFSIISLPNTTKCIIGTTEGHIFLYNLKYRCPLLHIRPSNRPAFLSPNDSNSFWVTCGPFATKINIEKTKIMYSISCLPSHVLFLCYINNTLITFHSDYSVHSISENNNIIDMNTLQSNIPFAKEANSININSHKTLPHHKDKILIVKKSPITSSAISYDASGRLIIWPNIFKIKNK